ncbi:angiotensinogen [Kryptolebias marmoratus]|uniref:Angiotensinogen n=1 Tax=Kryptolebias marmoratus TaxID=37003 RepID=A0A3Q3BFV6_KRYMA|nr:angiotensinogen [Kryptolebias marmoratus]
MQKLQFPLLMVLLCWCFSGSQANRVYVHPFNLFAAENVSCEPLQNPSIKPLETVPVALLDVEVLTPDNRDPAELDPQRQNISERTNVLSKLSNTLGERMYQALGRKHNSTNTLLSPVSTFGSLVNFYLGASKKTAKSFQDLLGLSRGTDGEDCVYLVDGHKVLSTLQAINSIVDDGPKDTITTQVWAFTHKDAQLSGDFIQGTQDFSDMSFIRGVDFSKPQEAEELVNSFVEKTSDGTMKNVFKDLSPNSNFLFISSFSFKGNWTKAFQPEKTSLEEFHVNETATVMTSMMTRTGHYHYMNDKMNKCTVVKLSLNKQSYILLVLPHEGVRLSDIESKRFTNLMERWHPNLQEGLLELSLPKFSVSSVNNLDDLLTNVNPLLETTLLGAEAEFSQLGDIKPFTIDKAINTVQFEMSEGEAEAQVKEQKAGIPLKTSFNKPFFFSVIEEHYDSVLLMGKVTDPTV